MKPGAESTRTLGAEWAFLLHAGMESGAGRLGGVTRAVTGTLAGSNTAMQAVSGTLWRSNTAMQAVSGTPASGHTPMHAVTHGAESGAGAR